jgi:hypothetical protein
MRGAVGLTASNSTRRGLPIDTDCGVCILLIQRFGLEEPMGKAAELFTVLLKQP